MPDLTVPVFLLLKPDIHVAASSFSNTDHLQTSSLYCRLHIFAMPFVNKSIQLHYATAFLTAFAESSSCLNSIMFQVPRLHKSGTGPRGELEPHRRSLFTISQPFKSIVKSLFLG